MRMVWAALLSLGLIACSAGPSPEPSPAIKAMRDQFEAEVLAIEKDYPGDANGLRAAAIDIAAKVYGADWNVVRAETQRSLAALPEIDLSVYETATPIPSMIDASSLREVLPFMTPGGLAALRFWDAASVGFVVAPMSVDLTRDGDAAMMIGTKLSLVPGRVWRGKFEGKDVIAARYMRSVVIAPYTLSTEGMIVPAFESLRVYALQSGGRAP